MPDDHERCRLKLFSMPVYYGGGMMSESARCRDCRAWCNRLCFRRVIPRCLPATGYVGRVGDTEQAEGIVPRMVFDR